MAAGRTIGCIHILMNGHLMSAVSAEDRLLIPLILRPARGPVAGLLFMAGPAGVVRPAAVKLNGNDINIAVVVRTACLSVNCSSLNMMHMILSLSLSYHVKNAQMKLYLSGIFVKGIKHIQKH